MSCYWTVNGIPACVSPLAQDRRVGGTCSCKDDEEAQTFIARCRRIYSDVEYTVVNEHCPEIEEATYKNDVLVVQEEILEQAIEALGRETGRPESYFRNILEENRVLRSADEKQRDDDDAKARDEEHQLQYITMVTSIDAWETTEDGLLFKRDPVSWRELHNR